MVLGIIIVSLVFCTSVKMRCAVFKCANDSIHKQNSRDKFRFYRFPKDENLLKKWIEFCGRPSMLNVKTARICSAHFVPEDIERNLQFEMGFSTNNGFKLKPGTIPTLNSETDDAAQKCKQSVFSAKAKKQPGQADDLESMDTKGSFSDWRLWCRLCAKSETQGNIDLMPGHNNQPLTLDDGDRTGHINGIPSLRESIGKFFGVNIQSGENLPSTICKECFARTRSLIAYSEEVSKVQQMFQELISLAESRSLDLPTLRLKYGLLDEGHGHVLGKQWVPEVLQEREECLIETEAGGENPLEQPHKEIQIKEDFEIGDEKHNVYFVEGIESTEELDNDDSSFIAKIRVSDENELSKLLQQSLDFANGEDKHERPSKLPKNCLVNQVAQQVNSVSKPEKSSYVPLKSGKLLHCSLCDDKFTGKYNLKKHFETIHLGLRKLIFPCPDCNRQFYKRWDLQRHIETVHRTERPFVCEQCGRSYKTKVILNEHMMTHKRDTVECEVCKKKYKNWFRLKKHKEIHKPNKHVCPICGNQLNSSACFRIHMLRHSNERRYKCDYCKSTFKRPEHLRSHLMSHMGLKPYSCNFCKRTFRQHIYKHVKKAHPEERFALQAAGGGKPFTGSIPTLEKLRAIATTESKLTSEAESTGLKNDAI